MTVTLGIVGPQDSVQKAISICESMDNINPLPLIYSEHDEILDIINKKLNSIDCLLFTGIIPYNKVYKNLPKNLPVFYVQRDNTTITKTLFQIVYTHKLSIDKISFDTFNLNEIISIFQELHLPLKDIFVLEHKPELKTEEIIRYHLSLYKAKKVNLCITCSLPAYNILKKKGIPVFRVVPSSFSIRQSIEKLQLQLENVSFKYSAISIGVISIDNFDDYISNYDSEKLLLKLHEILLSFSQKTQSSIVHTGGNEFYIYSTYGELISEDKNIAETELLEKVQALLNITISYGIGTGLTVQEAKNNAKIALFHSKKSKGNCIFIKEYSGKLKGPLISKKPDINVNIDKNLILQISQNKKIGESTLSKIFYIIENHLPPNFTAQQFADIYQCTERNARRLLKILEEFQIVTITNYEQPFGIGRPKKIYKKNY